MPLGYKNLAKMKPYKIVDFIHLDGNLAFTRVCVCAFMLIYRTQANFFCFSRQEMNK